MTSMDLKHEHKGLKRFYFHGDYSMEPQHRMRFFYDRRLDDFVPVELAADGGSVHDVIILKRELRPRASFPRGYFRPKNAHNLFGKHPLLKASDALLRKLDTYHRNHKGNDSRFEAMKQWEKVNGTAP